MNPRATIILLAGALLGASFLPSAASACSGVACEAPRLLAGEEIVVPANVPGLAITAPSIYGDVPETLSVRLVDVTGDEPTDVPVAVIDGMVVPLEGLIEGHLYGLEMVTVCADVPITGYATLFATAVAELPEAVGELYQEGAEPVGQIPVPETGGLCFDTVLASYVDVAVELDASVGPWADLLVWETLVDGLPYAPTGSSSPRNGYGLPTGYQHDPAGSWIGRGRDRIYTACVPPVEGTVHEGVEEGTHAVMFRASIPGTDLVFETPTRHIDISCTPTADGTYYDPSCPTSYRDGYTGMCVEYPTDEVCPDYYDPAYSSECPDYGYPDEGYYDDYDGGGWFFGCSATGGANASRGGAFGFGFLLLGAIVVARRRRRQR